MHVMHVVHVMHVMHVMRVIPVIIIIYKNTCMHACRLVDMYLGMLACRDLGK
jgi:hypothetical protein